MSDTATATRTPGRSSSATPTRTVGRPAPADSPRPGRSRRPAAQPSHTSDRASRATRPARTRPAVDPAADAAAGTAPFVLLIMVLLASGLVATLGLSTAAAADSYRLEDARTGTRDLSEQAEGLRRDVEAAQSAPSIAAAATRLGMVPAGAPAVLVVRPDGRTQLVGTPTPAVAPPAPAALAVPGAPVAPTTAAATATPASPSSSTPTSTTGDPEGPR